MAARWFVTVAGVRFNAARDRRVRRPRLAFVDEVVAREHLEHFRAAGRFGVALEIGDRALEQRPHPLAIEQLVDVGADRGLVRGDLAFRGLEIERHHRHAAAALEPPLGFPRVRREAIEAQPQVGAKAGARRIVLLDDLLLERRREELLREIGGFVGIERPLHAQVLVGRLPVRLDDRRERDAARLLVAAARPFDDRQPRRRKSHRARSATLRRHDGMERDVVPQGVRAADELGAEGPQSPDGARRRARDRCRLRQRPADRRADGAPAARPPRRHRSIVEHADDGARQPSAACSDRASSFAQVSLPDLPFAGWADLVFSTATFHWVKDHPALFAGIFTTLRSGGRLHAQCGGGPNLARAHELAEQVMHSDTFAPILRRLAGTVGVRLRRRHRRPLEEGRLRGCRHEPRRGADDAGDAKRTIVNS